MTGATLRPTGHEISAAAAAAAAGGVVAVFVLSALVVPAGVVVSVPDDDAVLVVVGAEEFELPQLESLKLPRLEGRSTNEGRVGGAGATTQTRRQQNWQSERHNKKRKKGKKSRWFQALNGNRLPMAAGAVATAATGVGVAAGTAV